jgi:hypothetical protein
MIVVIVVAKIKAKEFTLIQCDTLEVSNVANHESEFG